MIVFSCFLIVNSGYVYNYNILIYKMVKKYVQQLKRDQLYQHEKLIEKSGQLALQRKKDFIRDVKRWSIKAGVQYKRKPINIHEFIYSTASVPEELLNSQQNKEVKNEILHYKTAQMNAQAVLGELEKMNIKNSRPHDYLVEMYKSDKQMVKIRRYLTEKEERVKEKMQGKDWMSKTKRRQRAKKKAEAKKERKKSKIQANSGVKRRMIKVNGKNKVKK